MKIGIEVTMTDPKMYVTKKIYIRHLLESHVDKERTTFIKYLINAISTILLCFLFAAIICHFLATFGRPNINNKIIVSNASI